jgi:phosphatidylglycerol:prolipoprotein diacylglycerol transferase
VHPEIFQVGVLHVRSYGLLLAVAFLVGTWLALREARRLKLDEDRMVTVILVTLVASVLGARALYVLEHVDEFRREWGSIGGLLTARQLGLPMWLVADALTPSLALGTMFGRIGCFLNGCCYGRPTTLPWGVIYPADSFAGLEFGPVPVHPSQLYFALSGLVLFLVFWSLRRRFQVPGVLFWTFIAAFALVRIPLDFTRAYEPASSMLDVGTLHLTESQLTSALMLLFALLMIVRLRREARPLVAVPAAPAAPSA